MKENYTREEAEAWLAKDGITLPAQQESKELADELFLPELHAAWWAQELAVLRAKLPTAESVEKREQIQEQIQKHYKDELNYEITAERLSKDRET